MFVSKFENLLDMKQIKNVELLELPIQTPDHTSVCKVVWYLKNAAFEVVSFVLWKVLSVSR